MENSATLPRLVRFWLFLTLWITRPVIHTRAKGWILDPAIHRDVHKLPTDTLVSLWGVLKQTQEQAFRECDMKESDACWQIMRCIDAELQSRQLTLEDHFGF